jgi:peptidylamidoglycolate lyase
MLSKFQLLFITLTQLLLMGCSNIRQDNNIENSDSLNKYELVKNWPDLLDNFKLGNPTGIGIDTDQNVFIFRRAYREWPLIRSMPETYISSKTILMLDRKSGKILNSWGNNLFIMPHGLTVDRNNNIWVTDVGLHQVFKFSHDGKLLMKLGEAKIAGDDSTHFNRPTDVAVLNDGSFYVSDGYGNSRIIKFSSAGKYLFQWGTKGDKEGQFNIPHAIDLDEKGNVYVADRENKRVQIFSPAGKFLKQWTNKTFGSICSITFDKTKRGFIAVDDAASLFGLKHNGSNIILFDSTGNLLNQFGRNGAYNGAKRWYHDVAIDDEENIYVGDILGNKIEKFKKVSKQ